jgi:anti-sigma factor RsiW
MNHYPGPDAAPDPDLLAAYLDGALDGRADLCRQVELWLDRHPEARADLETDGRLVELFHDATPEEPDPVAWQRVWRQVQRVHRGEMLVLRASPRSAKAGSRARTIVACVAAACVAFLAWNAVLRLPFVPMSQRPGLEVLPVASADEVVVLRVEGDDTHTLVVGLLPLQGSLELADPGDVERISSAPAADDQMVPHFRIHGPHRPMIWARLDTEEMP